MKLTIYFLFVLVILALLFRIAFASGQVISKSYHKNEVEKYHLFEVRLNIQSMGTGREERPGSSALCQRCQEPGFIQRNRTIKVLITYQGNLNALLQPTLEF